MTNLSGYDFVVKKTKTLTFHVTVGDVIRVIISLFVTIWGLVTLLTINYLCGITTLLITTCLLVITLIITTYCLLAIILLISTYCLLAVTSNLIINTSCKLVITWSLLNLGLSLVTYGIGCCLWCYSTLTLN